DGRTLAVAAGDGIDLIVVDTGYVKTVATGLAASDVAWSPDGVLLAFAGMVNGREDIFTVNRQSEGVVNLTNSIASRERWPTWSPDGSLIAFQTDTDGAPSVAVIDAGGGEARWLGPGAVPAFAPQSAATA